MACEHVILNCGKCTAERDALREWRNSISNVIKTAPEFAPGQWAGNKEGWGYHFEIVAYVFRDRRLLAAEVANLQDSLKRSTEDWEEQFNKREALEARVQELLATIVKVTNETPYPDEIRGALEQRGTLLAEVGTLKARVAELEEAALRAAGSKP